MNTDSVYGFSRTVEMSFDEAVSRIKETLQSEGFGVLSEINIDEKFKEKLGVDFRRYKILGACNPSLAYKTLREEINIGLLLPCNVVVYEADEKNKTVVAAVDANAMLAAAGEKDILRETAAEADEKLRRAVSSV